MYAIIRTQKHTSNATLGGMEKHVDRTMDVPNANKNFSHINQTVIGKEGSLIETIDSRIDRLKKEHNPRVTKSSVKCIEYLMTATHEAFPIKEKNGKLVGSKEGSERWQKFVSNSMEFLVEKHGKGNVVKFTIHMDEKTPHIHAFVVPVTQDNRLSAKEFLGGKEKLRKLQSEFAEKMNPLGLQRGEEGSKAKHETVQEYYGRVDQAQHLSLAQDQLGSESKRSYELSKPPAMGRESWRSEQEELINEEIKRLQISLSNERSNLNDTKARLNEERATGRVNDSKIKKLEARIWHLENPELSKKVSEEKKIEKQILKGKKHQGPSL